MSHIQENIARVYSKQNKFREEEKFTDVTIQCESKSFKCHRLVLAASSPYFERMFGSGFKESISESIVLQGVSAATFEEILHFMYTGDVDVNAANVYDLLRLSDYYDLSSIEDLCLEFVVKKHLMTIQNLLPLFVYVCDTKKNNFISILSNLIAENFNVCRKFREFLDISFDHLQIILDQYLSLSLRNEESLLTAITRWTCYKREERLQYRHRLIGIIQFDNISPAFSRLMTEMLFTENDPVVALEGPESCHMVLESLKDKVLKTENDLFVYVKYNQENSIRIFSINNANECSNSKAIFNADQDTVVRCAVSDDLYLYCLDYLDQAPTDQNRQNQKFCAYTSVDRRVALTLTPPPLLLRSVSLCYLQNNIYAYNEDVTLTHCVTRTNTKSCEMFNDEEIKRGVYVYNCSIDNWFPVPEMKEVHCDSCMTTHENTLYLIGGSRSPDYFPSKGTLQAFDSRAGWRTLPTSHNIYCRASCCSLNGKIYVCGGEGENHAERYDPIASRWETIQSMDNGGVYHRMIPFDNKLWVMGSHDLDRERRIYLPSNDLSLNVYDVTVNEWSKSSILTEAADALIVKATTILDGVVFNIL